MRGGSYPLCREILGQLTRLDSYCRYRSHSIPGIVKMMNRLLSNFHLDPPASACRLCRINLTNANFRLPVYLPASVFHTPVYCWQLLYRNLLSALQKCFRCFLHLPKYPAPRLLPEVFQRLTAAAHLPDWLPTATTRHRCAAQSRKKMRWCLLLEQEAGLNRHF